ncbi:MAG TPA: hypothetical protein VND45_13135, partial [Thermoanaerobaculia bacterium]|nr:hypothetical protein [Thermoanaerobaculia bacterium]
MTGNRRRVGTTLLSLLAAFSFVLAVASVGRVLVQRSMDHDELEQAHTTWLISIGDIPFRDFFEVHPPFSWLALAPVARGAADAESLLLRLRAVTTIAQFLTILLLAANMRLGRREIHPLWTAAALLLMLTTEKTHDYFAEFRVDPWSTAFLLGGILAARLGRPRHALFGFLAAASVLWSPKLVALAGLFTIVELARLRRAALRAALRMIAGGIAALLVAWLVLWFAGIEPKMVYILTVRYHTLLAKHGDFGYGLAAALWDMRLLTLPAMIGMLLWLVFALRRELRPNAFEVAVALFLLAELVLVPFPYKQYFTPWMLLAAVFLPFWSMLFARIRVTHQRRPRAAAAP